MSTYAEDCEECGATGVDPYGCGSRNCCPCPTCDGKGLT